MASKKDKLDELIDLYREDDDQSKLKVGYFEKMHVN